MQDLQNVEKGDNVKYWLCFAIGWTGGLATATTAYEAKLWAFVPAVVTLLAYFAVQYSVDR